MPVMPLPIGRLLDGHGTPLRSRPDPSTDYVSQSRTVHGKSGGLWDGRNALIRRQLLTDEERQVLLGISPEPDGLARFFTLSRSDQDLVAGRRNDVNRLG